MRIFMGSRGNINSFIEARSANRRLAVAITIAGAYIVVALIVGWLTKRQESPQVTFTSGTAGLFVASGCPYGQDAPVNLQEWQHELPAAYRAWKRTLPSMDLPMPTLIGDGRQKCGTSASIACVDSIGSGNVIHIAGLYNEYDAAAKRSILMHEIGHLLGVPHIAGDILMNPEYGRPVEDPTAAALALAALRNPPIEGDR